MTSTYIDSASINSIAHFLSQDNLSDIDTWTLDVAREVSTALLLTNNLFLIPSPEPKSPSYGKFGALKRKLSAHVFDNEELKEFHEIALRNTLRWTGKNTTSLKKVFNDIFAKEECVEWLQKEKSRIWQHHTDTHNGLFNLAFNKQLGEILDINTKDLKSLHSLSCNPDEITGYLKQNLLTNDFEAIERAYILSALIRGIYQDYIARVSKNSIIQHPLRRDDRFFPKVVRRKQIKTELPNTASLLAEIILWVSLKESPANRLNTYTQYIQNARSAILAEEVDITNRTTVNAARDTAIRSAKQLGIHTNSKNFYRTIDIIIALSTGAISSFVLSPFIGFAFGAGTYAASMNAELGEKIGSHFDTTKKYREIFENAPGRITSSSIK